MKKEIEQLKKNIEIIDKFIIDKEWNQIFKILFITDNGLARNIINSINRIPKTRITDFDYEKNFEAFREKYYYYKNKASKVNEINKKWLFFLKAYTFYALIEVITEGSIITSKLHNHLKKKYKNDFLNILSDVDKNDPSKLTNIKSNKKEVNIDDKYIKLYLLMKKWQDNQHLFHDAEVGAAFATLSKQFYEYVHENKPYLKDIKGYDLLLLYNLDNLSIISIKDLYKYKLVGADKNLNRIIGGKAYGLLNLSFNNFKIPKTYVIPVGSILKKDYIKELDKLNFKTFSVRSSATVEDNIKNSFAGIFKTKLNIKKSYLKESITEVANSIYEPQVDIYKNYFKTQQPYMAVIIQNYIAPDKAGVWIGQTLKSGMFEYVKGSGEKLVNGKCTPINEKCPNSNGIKIKNVLLGDLFLHAQEKFLIPCDFEWCIKNNNLIWLQFRPVTTKMKYKKISKTSLIKGCPCSGGIVQGKPFFFKEPNNASFNNILLADYTDPSWLELMIHSKAVVTAEGGFLSHAAIISRELNIPCISGIGYNNIDKLKSSTLIEVNGNTGLIKIIK